MEKFQIQEQITNVQSALSPPVIEPTLNERLEEYNNRLDYCSGLLDHLCLGLNHKILGVTEDVPEAPPFPSPKGLEDKLQQLSGIACRLELKLEALGKLIDKL